MARQIAGRFREVLFQLHLWVGLVFFLLIAPVALTGSVLMFPEQVNRVGNPTPRVAPTDGATLAPSEYLERARSALPDTAKLQSLRLPQAPGDAVAVAASVGRAGPEAGRVVWLDPRSGELIRVGHSTSALFRLSHDLHGSLLVRGVGRQLIGATGVILLLLSLTGVWLWWPKSGSLAKALRWRRTPDTLMNLHYTAGFWISIPLAIVSATGVLIAFPQLTSTLLGSAAPPAAVQGVPARSAAALNAPSMTIDEVVATAKASHPSGRLTAITLPGASVRPGPQAGQAGAWRVDFAEGDRTETVRIDDRTKAVSATERPRQGAATVTPQRMVRELHEGELGGSAWKAAVFLTGLLPLLLGGSGAYYWAKLELRKSRARRDRRGEG